MLDVVRKQLFNIGSATRAERETFSLSHFMVIEKKTIFIALVRRESLFKFAIASDSFI